MQAEPFTHFNDEERGSDDQLRARGQQAGDVRVCRQDPIH